MRFITGTVVLVVVVLLGVSGCQKASNTSVIDATLDVPSQGTKAKIVDGPSREQKISVSAQCENGSFSVYVLLEKDREAFEEKLTNLKTLPATTLSKQEKTKEASLATTVPAKQDYAILLLNPGSKSIQVKLKVMNVP
jgi:hypothetical protein